MDTTKNVSVISKDDHSQDAINETANEPSSHPATISTTNDNSSSNNRLKYGRVVILLENPILPDETIASTPSMADGLEPDIENDLRITACKLIQIAGILLRLPQVAMATGQVLFQRFYYLKSFVRQPMEITAMACVVLASKVEEAPRRIRDVINVFHNMKQIRLEQPIVPIMLDENYVFLKNQVIKAERRILKELGFCVHVKHPHKFIVAVAQILKNESNVELIQAAWNYMNDSLQTNVFVRFPPEAIACACIHLSSRILRVSLPTKPLWYELFKVDTETIESICRSILMLYTRKTIPQEELEAKVESAKQKLDAEKLKARKQALVQNSNHNDNTRSPNLADSHTNSPTCSNDTLPNKGFELKSVIGKLIKERAMKNAASSEGTKQNDNSQAESDHSSVSSSSSFKLQKSPIKQEDTKLASKSLADNDDNYQSSNSSLHHHRSSYYKNGHHSNDFYSSDSKEKRREKKDYKKYLDRSTPRSYISSTVISNDNDNYINSKPNRDDRYRNSRSRSRSPVSPSQHDQYVSSRHNKYYRVSRNEERISTSHRNVEDYDKTHTRYRTEDVRDNRRYEESRNNRRNHDYYQQQPNRSRSRSPNYSSSRYHSSSSHHHYHKSSGGKH